MSIAKTPEQSAPVSFIEPDKDARQPEEGMALCLSGGGYRAMVFHAGALQRLNDAGLLPGLKRVSSVSGGSIAAGVLGLKWSKLRFKDKVASNFVEEVISPICGMASVSIDVESFFKGKLPWGGTVAERVADAYAEHLFGKATLQDLPADKVGPRFVINATNVQSGALWRFSRAYMGDYLVGRQKSPTVPLAVAVAASSAFPPVLSPCILKLDPKTVVPDGQSPLNKEPFTSKVILTDGGVYDNLGLETAWKRYKTILVSDGGASIPAEDKPSTSMIPHLKRIIEMIDHQVGCLRKRQLIESFKAKSGPLHRKGTYWGVRTHIADYGLKDALPCPADRTTELASTATRLQKMPRALQERLMNWGYAVCDAALRAHVDRSLPKPAGFPYPKSGI